MIAEHLVFSWLLDCIVIKRSRLNTHCRKDYRQPSALLSINT